WNNGKIEKTSSMNQTQISIFKILSRLFNGTELYQQGGIFISETDMRTGEHQLRRPDLAIYSKEQEEKMINGENQVAPWVGEVISPTDNINRVQRKMHEYFVAGVKVVWHIFPDFEEVYVYTAPNQVTICDGERICNGQPALEDFEISAADIFAYKKLLKTQE
ncbi:MAG: Uma2 family endonuclease, partial [Bacteroidota bacterium]